MFCAPIVKLKSDKIPLKRLSACVTPAAKRKQAILYKKILKIAIKAFRVPGAITAGTDSIESMPETKRIADLCVARCRAQRLPSMTLTNGPASGTVSFSGTCHHTTP